MERGNGENGRGNRDQGNRIGETGDVGGETEAIEIGEKKRGK